MAMRYGLRTLLAEEPAHGYELLLLGRPIPEWSARPGEVR